MTVLVILPQIPPYIQNSGKALYKIIIVH